MNTVRNSLFFAIALFILFLTSTASYAKSFKIATLSPDGSSWMVSMREAAKEIKNVTEGRVKIKFYPGGVMGDDKTVLRKIRVGQLQGAAVSGGSLSKFFPDTQIYSLPMRFNSFEEVDYVRQRMDKMITDGLEENGFVNFGLGEGGLAFIMSDSPIYSLDDLRKKKVWAPNTASSILTFESFNISPIPLSLGDVLPSLQTGLINTVATSPIATIALQWHNQVNYLNETPVMYYYALLAIQKKSFNKISVEDQTSVRQIMGDTFLKIDRQNRKDNIAASEALKKQGIKFIRPKKEDVVKWKQLSNIAIQKLIDQKIISKHSVDTLEQHLKTYRASQSQ